MNKKKMDVEFSPLRSLDDFLLESARFQIPNFKDFEKWGNRVVNNLLYYQTNYFFLSIVIFYFSRSDSSHQNAVWNVSYGSCILAYFTTSPMPKDQQQDSRKTIQSSVSSWCWVEDTFIVYMLGSVVVFLFGILLPIMVNFIHASMRLRNVKNKLVNKMEVIGLKRTPMGLFLEALGMEQEVLS